MGKNVVSAELIKKLQQDFAAAQAAVKSVPVPQTEVASVDVIRGNAAIVKDLQQLKKEFEKVQGEVDQAAQQYEKNIAAARKEFAGEVAKMLKAYNAAVRKSDGATSVRPSAVKALQQLAKAPGRKTVSDAVSALETHKASLAKETAKTAKTDRRVGKAVGAFTKGIDETLKHLAEVRGAIG